MYDFAFIFKATEGKIYSGKTTFTAEWKGETKGNGTYSIGTAENPWPTIEEPVFLKYIVALLATLLTVFFFFCVMKILIPFINKGVFAPDQGFMAEYVNGAYILPNGSIMEVSRGLGRESTFAPRFFNHPEIVVIDIH